MLSSRRDAGGWQRGFWCWAGDASRPRVSRPSCSRCGKSGMPHPTMPSPIWSITRANGSAHFGKVRGMLRRAIMARCASFIPKRVKHGNRQDCWKAKAWICETPSSPSPRGGSCCSIRWSTMWIARMRSAATINPWSFSPPMEWTGARRDAWRTLATGSGRPRGRGIRALRWVISGERRIGPASTAPPMAGSTTLGRPSQTSGG